MPTARSRTRGGTRTHLLLPRHRWYGCTSASVTVTLTINPVANIALNVQDPARLPGDELPLAGPGGCDVPHQSRRSAPRLTDTLSTNFHKSYMPVVAQGCVGAGCDALNETIPVTAFNQVALDPAKHYYVSVLPNDAAVEPARSLDRRCPDPARHRQQRLTVIVNNQPIPTRRSASSCSRTTSRPTAPPTPTSWASGASRSPSRTPADATASRAER